jgi:hypothetical protein
VYGIERISGSRGAGAVFGRVESHKRAQNVSMPDVHAIADYDLGHEASFETSAGDDVIPRSWSMPYTASACFFFEKIVQATNCKRKKKRIDSLLLLSACLVGLYRQGCGWGIDGDRML